MLQLGLFIIGCLSSSHALEGADVVLSCSFVEEGGGMMGGAGGGALFSRTPATLVLRDLPVVSDEDASLDSVTPFNPPESPNADDLIFEVKGASVELPDADVILHADCNEQEVTCEISHYIPRGADPHAPPTHFIASLQVEGGGVSMSLVMQVLTSADTGPEAPPLMQSKLQIPLSQSGTLLTEAVFVVFSRARSLTVPVGGDAQLDCGFRRQQATPPKGVPGLEWRLQHRGSGRRILDMKTNEEEVEAGPQVTVGREGASVDPALALEEGNVTLSLPRLRVADEGTYICTVTSGVFQTQQIVQLNIIQPPKVSLSEERTVYLNEPAQKLSCHCKSYYPLDVKVEWLSIISLEEEPEEIKEGMSLSSHRQHADGTFSVSSHLTFPLARYAPGTTVTCRVTHQALPDAADVSSRVLEPEGTGGDFYSVVITVLVVTVGTAIFYQVMGAN